MRKLVGALILALLALAGGTWWAYQSRDALLASAIRTYGPQITGVPVRLGGVRLLPAEGVAIINGLELGNPPGFKTPNALVLDQVHLRLDLASLSREVVQIHEISIRQPRVSYEHAASGSNLDVIQRHVEAYVATHTGASAQVQTSKPTRLIIERFTLQGASAEVSADALNGKVVTLKLPAIRLDNIGKKSGGVTPAEAASQIVGALRRETTRAVLPLHLGGVAESIRKGAASVVDSVKGFFK